MTINEKFMGNVITYQPSPESKILLDAADLIKKHGHTKYVLADRDGSLCLLGAMNTAAHGVWSHPSAPNMRDELEQKPIVHYAKAMEKLCLYVGNAYPKAVGQLLHEWNNEADRTPEEVITALEGAAMA